jgi:hypothetical protein
MSKEKLLTIGTLAALCVLAAFSMHAKAAGQEGMVVVRDPLTGQLRAPTADELKELRAKTPATAGVAAPRAPAAISRSDGSRGMRLGEKGMVYDVVTRGPDGTLTHECVQSPDLDHNHNHGESKNESR